MTSSARPTNVLEDVALLLGAKTGRASLASLGLDALQGRTRKQLLEAARRLGLTRVSKLTKEALARRVQQALKADAQASPPEARASKGARKQAAEKRSAEPVPAPAPEPERAAAVLEPAATAKLDLGPGVRHEEPVEHIPWSYGMDRVTAAAVDPDGLYVYWEVTDQSIEQARAGLGPGGPSAWLSLRVYDTSGLIFDGTNAHSYFDQQIERTDRQWFFSIGKPSSTAFVEVGMKSLEGYFVKVARSGRVDFPRKEPTPWGEPEWMTVSTSTGELQHAGAGGPPRGAAESVPPPSDSGLGAPPSPFTPIPLWLLRESANGHETRGWQLLEGGWERIEWHEVRGEGWFELEGHSEWEGPRTVTTWEAGPFAYPVDVEPPQRQEWQGRSFAFKVGNVTHVVHGPWQVVIRNLGAFQDRSVVARWEIYRSWVTEAWREEAVQALALRPGGSELVAMGASGRMWIAGSEVRLGGASEVWRIGASEVRLRGASERLFVGASQWVALGASERRLLGASENRLGGASERALGGASERLGASERRIGGSEQRFEGGSATPLPYSPAEGAYPAVE